MLIGSVDEMIMSALKTGDVLLFKRKWYHLYPIPALISSITSSKLPPLLNTTSPLPSSCMGYNGMGVVVVNGIGDVYVVEREEDDLLKSLSLFSTKPTSREEGPSKALKITRYDKRIREGIDYGVSMMRFLMNKQFDKILFIIGFH